MSPEQEPHQESCNAMARALADPDIPIAYLPAFREYGIEYKDGGTSHQLIAFCPWCGSPLPASLRDRWFDAIDALGMEPGDPHIPMQYATERWWRT
jgi:hypothetical protein